MSTTIYLSIGNSDDHLTQGAWSAYCHDINVEVRRRASIVFGEWYSLPSSQYQNACWAFVLDDGKATGGVPESLLVTRKETFKTDLAQIAAHYEQDSIAWVEGETEFIGSNKHAGVRFR